MQTEEEVYGEDSDCHLCDGAGMLANDEWDSTLEMWVPGATEPCVCRLDEDGKV